MLRSNFPTLKLLLFPQTIHTAYFTIDSINKHVVDSLSLDSRLNELSSLINKISVQEINMRSFAEHHDQIDKSTIQRLAEWTVAPQSTSIQGMLDQIQILMVGHPSLDYIGKGSLLVQLGEYLKVSRSHSFLLFCIIPGIQQYSVCCSF